MGTCPLHSHERYKALYDKLVETARAQAVVVTPEEESDMEASDVEDEVPNVNSDSLPLGTTFRTIHIIQPPNPQQQHSQPVTSESVGSTSRTFMPRKLSTISSQDRESIQAEEENEDLEAKAGEKTTEAEVHAKLLNTTDFEWHPDENEEVEDEVKDDPESEALLESSQQEHNLVKAKSRYKNTDVWK